MQNVPGEEDDKATQMCVAKRENESVKLMEGDRKRREREREGGTAK